MPLRPIVAALLFAAIVSKGFGADAKWVSYMPAVSTLTGTITEEAYPEDNGPRYRGAKAWILHLDRPISLRGEPNDPFAPQALDVTEIDLNIDHRVRPKAGTHFGKGRFAVTGTLYQAPTTHFLRPIVLYVTRWKRAKVR